jgi:hypothetical protein
MCSATHFVTNAFNRMMIHVALKSQAFGCHRWRPDQNLFGSLTFTSRYMYHPAVSAWRVLGQIPTRRHSFPNCRISRRCTERLGGWIGAGAFTRQSAAEAIAARTVDAVALGKLLIANPDLPLRLKTDTPLNQYDHSTFYGVTAKGYTDYPTLRELSSSQAQTAGVEACDLKQ